MTTSQDPLQVALQQEAPDKYVDATEKLLQDQGGLSIDAVADTDIQSLPLLAQVLRVAERQGELPVSSERYNRAAGLMIGALSDAAEIDGHLVDYYGELGAGFEGFVNEACANAERRQAAAEAIGQALVAHQQAHL